MQNLNFKQPSTSFESKEIKTPFSVVYPNNPRALNPTGPPIKRRSLCTAAATPHLKSVRHIERREALDTHRVRSPTETLARRSISRLIALILLHAQ